MRYTCECANRKLACPSRPHRSSFFDMVKPKEKHFTSVSTGSNYFGKHHPCPVRGDGSCHGSVQRALEWGKIPVCQGESCLCGTVSKISSFPSLSSYPSTMEASTRRLETRSHWSINWSVIHWNILSLYVVRYYRASELQYNRTVLGRRSNANCTSTSGFPTSK